MSNLRLQLPLAIAITALAAGPLQAEQVAPVEVQGRAPTSVTVTLAGKAPAAVRHEIRIAARYVCNNAVAANELSPQDTNWCSDATNARAQARYRVIRRQFERSGQQVAGAPPVITLAMR